MLGINAAYSLKMEVTHRSSGFVVVFLWKGLLLFFILRKTEKGVYEYKRREEMGVINMKVVAKGGVIRKNSAETRLRVRREKIDLKGKSGQVLF